MPVAAAVPLSLTMRLVEGLGPGLGPGVGVSVGESVGMGVSSDRAQSIAISYCSIMSKSDVSPLVDITVVEAVSKYPPSANSTSLLLDVVPTNVESEAKGVSPQGTHT